MLTPLTVPISHIAVAALIAVSIATLARRRSLLDRSGAIAAALLGPALVATGGWWIGAILVAFFVTSSLLPHPDAEHPERTWHQVLANGGPALALSALGLVADQSGLLLATAASIAATAADTWATEIGRRFGGTPRSILTWRRVPPGTSGAISAIGTLASVTGAATIAILAALLAVLIPGSPDTGSHEVAVLSAAGTLGSAIDTVLGATVQARFVCATCGHRSESDHPHLPGHRMEVTSGLGWVTNSVVNAGAASAAALLSLLAL